MNILISGAGVAGPALAHWLGRQGHSCTIVERSPGLRDGGHAVDFRGRAHLTVLRRMGIKEAVERHRTRAGASWIVDEHGREIAAMPEDLFAGDIEILRGDLVRILHEHAPAAEYVHGDSIASITEDPGGVDVTFEKSPPRRFDLVVGADGLHSTVRALTFGPEERFLHHLGLYCAIFTVPNHLGLDRGARSYNTPGRIAAVYSGRDASEARAMFWFASPPLTYDRRDVAAQRRLLAAKFDGMGWEVPALLGLMDDAPDFYFDSAAQIVMDRWSRGRVVLLGDAAWCASPLSGMGTGLAMVGAYVFAGELAAAGGDHTAAFARYEQVMRGYVTGCQKSAHGTAEWMVPSSRLRMRLTTAGVRVMRYLPWTKLIARSIRKTAEAVSLKDYAFTPPAGPAPRPRPSGRAS